MPYFRKKPITIEARQVVDTPECGDEIVEWTKDSETPASAAIRGTPSRKGKLLLSIRTLEGPLVVLPGDWIIRGVHGEFYPCKPEIFEATYEPVSEPPAGYTFSDVVAGLKRGRRFARAGWNGRGMFIFLVPGSRFKVNREPLQSILGEGTEVDYHGHVDMRTASGQIVPWLCSQTDLLAEDWLDA